MTLFITTTVKTSNSTLTEVFGNRVLRGIFRSKWDEIIGGWRKLHYDEVHYLYLLVVKYNQNDQVKEDEMGSTCSTHGNEEECAQGFGGNARRKKTLRKTLK
jgi:hypothetical protein